MGVLKDPRLREIVETARRENQRKARRIRERKCRARAFLPNLVQAFRAIDPDIEAIVLFGSLAEGAVRSEHFDIDIAVRSKKYLKLVAWALDQSFRIDVVDLDGAPPHIAERIRAKREILYAGKKDYETLIADLSKDRRQAILTSCALSATSSGTCTRRP